MKKKLIFIVGPTASGKSKVAAHLAKEINGEIISSDSMQVYKDMGIITQAPGEDLLSKAKHHLVGIIPPEEEFSAAKFREESKKLISSILSRGKTPVFAGGTGLYIKSLLDGLFASPPKDEKLRSSLEKIAKEKSPGYLYKKLQKIDPDYAAKIHENDLRRIIRALEVFEVTGSTMTGKKDETSGIRQEYDTRLFGLLLPRNLLYARIDSRVDSMFAGGLAKEVEELLARELSITAQKALGIREVSLYLKGELTIDGAKEELKKNTRRYAKRQLTWFRKDAGIDWINAEKSTSDIVKEILGKF